MNDCIHVDLFSESRVFRFSITIFLFYSIHILFRKALNIAYVERNLKKLGKADFVCVFSIKNLVCPLQTDQDQVTLQ